MEPPGYQIPPVWGLLHGHRGALFPLQGLAGLVQGGGLDFPPLQGAGLSAEAPEGLGSPTAPPSACSFTKRGPGLAC